MISRSTLLHLRIPFSFYLMPVFFFAAAIGGVFANAQWTAGHFIVNFFLTFISIHLFLYPASNGFNSYYDKDEKAIGGLEHPPTVTRELLYVSLFFDAIAVLLGLFMSWQFAVMLFIYGLVSKAYSHPAIRLKKYGVIAWLTAGIFQGGFTFIMVIMGLWGIGFEVVGLDGLLLPAAVSTLMILGFYPLTQVYQHEEDALHGDNTISRRVGIRGTFILSAVMFALADAGFYFYYSGDGMQVAFAGILWFWALQFFHAPVLVYFTWWFYQVTRNETAASFRNAMRMNRIASACLVAFFIIKMVSSS